MPIYEYECSSCKFYSEIMQKISDAPLKKCPSCGKSAMKKLISAPVFRLKGGGWYETDFKSEGENKRNLADREEPATKDEKPSETKKEGAADAPARPKTRPAKTGKAPSKVKPAARTAPRKAARPAPKRGQAARRHK